MKPEKLYDRLEKLLPEYARPQMALTRFLKIIRDEKNTIEPQDVTALSKICQVKTEEIIKLIDRYAYFSDDRDLPIHVCMGLPCYLNGAQVLFDEIVAEQKKLNGQSKSVETINCLGYCYEAPVARLGDGITYSGRHE